jgi:hypothetical protein
MRIPSPLIAALVALLACNGCTGGTYVNLPIFPDSSCPTCGTSSRFDLQR